MNRPNLREHVDTAAALYDTEVELRARARVLELQPNPNGEVAYLYDRANDLKEKRLTLLHRIGLI